MTEEPTDGRGPTPADPPQAEAAGPRALLRDRWGRRDWLILLGLLLVTLAAWAPVIFSRHWSFGVEVDFLRQFYPARFFAASTLSHGTFPLWNPYVLSGQAYFASYQTAMLYPLNLLMVGLYGAAHADFSLKALCIYVVFHYLFAGVFTYVLARELKIGRTGATVAAVTYMFSGYLLAHAGHVNQQNAAAWIPLIFFLFYRALDRRMISYAVGAGAALGIALLAGHLQPPFYLCLLLLAFVVFSGIQRARGDPRMPGFWYGLMALAVTVVVAGSLAAVQLIPTYQMIGLSSRRVVPFAQAATYSLPRRQLITLIFPHFYGSSPKGYMGFWTMWEMYGYAGIVGGALGVVALLRKKKGLVVFLWIVLVLALILALGPGGYLFTALYKSHLLFDRFRDPARMFLIFGFTSALLAGFGADHVMNVISDEDARERYRPVLRLAGELLGLTLLLVLAVSLFLVSRGPKRQAHTSVALHSMILPTALLAGLFLLLLLAGRIKDRGVVVAVGMVALVLVDLAVQGVPWTMVRVNPDDIFGDKRASQYIARQPGEFRVETDANTMYMELDDGALYGLQKASGDDSLVLENYYRYRELVAPSIAPGVQLGLFHVPGITSPLLDAMNDVYFISRDRINATLTAGKLKQRAVVQGIHIYQNMAAAPRAWMSDAVVKADNERVFDELARTGGKGITERALVAAPPGSGLTVGRTIHSIKGTVTVTEVQPHRLVIKTDPSSKGLLVVSEVSYPGWDVFIDGKKGKILDTNFLFRGVVLPGGQRTVEFRFHPGSVYDGMVISLVTLVLLLGYAAALLLARRRMKKPGKEAAASEAVNHNAGL
jgi:hypothetical protein